MDDEDGWERPTDKCARPAFEEVDPQAELDGMRAAMQHASAKSRRISDMCLEVAERESHPPPEDTYRELIARLEERLKQD